MTTAVGGGARRIGIGLAALFLLGGSVLVVSASQPLAHGPADAGAPAQALPSQAVESHPPASGEPQPSGLPAVAAPNQAKAHDDDADETPEPPDVADASEASDASAEKADATDDAGGSGVDHAVSRLGAAGITTNAADFGAIAEEVGVGGAVRVFVFADASGKAPADIEAMFLAGTGWGEIARQLDLAIGPGIGSIMGNGAANGQAKPKAGTSTTPSSTSSANGVSHAAGKGLSKDAAHGRSAEAHGSGNDD